MVEVSGTEEPDLEDLSPGATGAGEVQDSVTAVPGEVEICGRNPGKKFILKDRGSNTQHTYLSKTLFGQLYKPTCQLQPL